MHVMVICYFRQVQSFPNGEPLALAEIFPIQKFTSFATEKSHVSDILYQAYMGKSVIYRTLAMSIIDLYLCIVATCTYIYIYIYIYIQGCLRTQDPLQYYVQKESSFVWQDFFWCRAFFAYSISVWPYQAPWSYPVQYHTRDLRRRLGLLKQGVTIFIIT